MSEIRIPHEFECDADTFWERIFLNEAWNNRFYSEVLKFPGWKLLEQTQSGDFVRRRVQIDPPLTGLPGPVKKLVGDRFSYIEEGTYDPSKRRYEFIVTPSTLPEKTRTKGWIQTEPGSNGLLLRTAYLFVEVKVMMLGGLVEEKILADFRQSTESAAAFTRETIRDLKAS